MLKVAGSIPLEAAPIYTVHEGAHAAVDTAHKGDGGATSQLDLPSLTPLSVAGCGPLHITVAHWATSIALLQVVDN